jgi:hypothetical protein
MLNFLPLGWVGTNQKQTKCEFNYRDESLWRAGDVPTTAEICLRWGSLGTSPLKIHEDTLHPQNDVFRSSLILNTRHQWHPGTMHIRASTNLWFDSLTTVFRWERPSMSHPHSFPSTREVFNTEIERSMTLRPQDARVNMLTYLHANKSVKHVPYGT